MGCLASSFRYEKLEEGHSLENILWKNNFWISFGYNPNRQRKTTGRGWSVFSRPARHTAFDREARRQLARGDQSKKRKLFSTAFVARFAQSCRQKRITLVVFLTILSSFCRLIQPVALSFLLEEITNSSSPDTIILYLYLAALCISSSVEWCVYHHICHNLLLMAVEVKASLIGLVYKKVGAC